MKERLDYLDSTRGIASLMVVLSHFIGAYNLPTYFIGLNHSVLHSFWHGKGAVSYFFVLSGFVLSYTYFNNDVKFKTMDYGEFVLKRILRIYPAFLAVLVISWICSNFLFNPNELNFIPEASNWIKLFWLQKTSVVSLFKEAILLIRLPQDPEQRLINQDWTLTIELTVSFLIPVLILIAKRSTWWVLFFLLVILRLHGMHWIIEFCCGVFVAGNLPHFRTLYQRLSILIKFIALAASLVIFSLEFLIPITETFSIMATKISVCLLLIQVLCSAKLQRFLSFKPLVWLGEISYCLYLSHFIIILLVSPYIFSVLTMHAIDGDISSRAIVLMVTLMMSILVAYLLHIIVERPAIRHSIKIIKMINFNRTKVK